MNLKDHIAHIPDFPKPGILFYDISPMLAHAAAWRACVNRLAEYVAPHAPDVLVGIESRGFLVAAPLAIEIGCGFIMVRKGGKLPGPTVGHTYELEYGTDTIEMQSCNADYIKLILDTKKRSFCEAGPLHISHKTDDLNIELDPPNMDRYKDK